MALKQGDYERTEELLKKVIAKDIEAVQEMQYNAKQRLLSAAAFTASVGDVQSTQLDYVRAADYYRQAAELTPPDEELISANYLSRQGQSLFKAGDYNGAQSLLKQVLEIREKKLGQEHSDTAQSLNDLAKTLQAQSQYREAESLYHRALAIRRKMLGSEHPDIAESLNDLGEYLKTKLGITTRRNSSAMPWRFGSGY